MGLEALAVLSTSPSFLTLKGHGYNKPAVVPFAFLGSGMQWDVPVFPSALPHGVVETPHAVDFSVFLLNAALFYALVGWLHGAL